MSKKAENGGKPVKKYIAVLMTLLLASCLWGCGPSDGSWQPLEQGVSYINADGKTVTGFQQIEGKTYYFDEAGLMTCGWLELDGNTYYFAHDGSMVTGWQKIDGSSFYFRESGTMVIGWLSIEGQKYCLTANGPVSGVSEVDGTRYLFREDGLLTSGWLELDGKRYYADENCHPLSGWQHIDGKWYLLQEDYSAYTGWLELDGYSYYFTEDGSAATGYVTVDGEELAFTSFGQQILLVNPWNYLPEDYIVELVSIGRGHQIASCAYEDYQAMIADCEAAGMDPVVCSSYRTWETQKELYQNRIYRFKLQGYSEEEATELAGTVVAIPGTSEHQMGLALDIIDSDNWKLDETQASMPTQQWLMEHSWEYGWILRYPEGSSESTGIIYEPWHYRYVGREAAADIHESGLCLEDYLQMLTEE